MPLFPLPPRLRARVLAALLLAGVVELSFLAGREACQDAAQHSAEGLGAGRGR